MSEKTFPTRKELKLRVAKNYLKRHGFAVIEEGGYTEIIGTSDHTYLANDTEVLSFALNLIRLKRDMETREEPISL